MARRLCEWPVVVFETTPRATTVQPVLQLPTVLYMEVVARAAPLILYGFVLQEAIRQVDKYTVGIESEINLTGFLLSIICTSHLYRHT